MALACGATLRLTADLASGSPLAEALLRPPRRDSQLTLLQLDRSQFLPLAALQLLRHTASGGASCGALLLLHEHDSPELRLDLQPCVLRLQPYAMEAAAIYVMIARAARASTCAAPWSPSARAAAS